MIFEKARLQRVFRIVILALIISSGAPGVNFAASDVAPPTLSNLNVSKQEATVGDEVKITADVIDEVSGVDDVRIRYKSPLGTASKYINLRLNSATGKYEGSFVIEKYDSSGNWGIDEISLRDKQGNYYYYYHSDDRTSKGEGYENIDLSQYDVKVSGTEEDNSAPTLNELIITPRNVTEGDTVKVEADVTDDLSGVDDIRIRYKSPLGTASKYINLRLNSATGKYEGSFVIEKYDSSGNWGIDEISLRDKQGNYYYYYHSDNSTSKGEGYENIDLSEYDVVVEETDKIAPVTSIELTSSTPMNNEWYPSNVTAALSATDEESGIKKVEYRINEGTWIEYTDAFEISEEGEVQLDYRSVDNVGNVEEIQTETIKIDKTSPVTTTSEVPSNWGNEEVELSLTAKDESSGMKSIEYRINEGDWKAYNTPILIAKEGKNAIEYRSTDQAGNQEEIKSVDVNLDLESPETSLSSVSDEWHTSDVELTLNSSDALSGVERTEYRVNEGEWVNYNTSILVEEDGNNKVEFRSIDHAGNVEATQSKVVKVDKTAPVTSTGNVLTDWSKQDIELTLSSSDELSGVASIEYRINEGKWTAYSDPITVDREGSTTIEYRSIDQAGNEEDIQSVVVKIDKTAPVTTASEIPAEWLNEEVELTLTAEEELSGPASIEYKLNGSEWTSYNGTVTLSQEGENVVEYRSVDGAGNEEDTKSLTVKLDLIAPETSINDVSDQWQDSSVELALSATDSLTGVSKTEYRINDGEWTSYSTPVELKEEGTHKLEYRSFDKAGNEEDIQSKMIKIDTTSPVTSMSSENQDTAVEVTLSSSDALSGVKKTEYRINQGEWQEYNTAILVTEEGTNTVDYRSLDIAGNVEEINSSDVTIEKPSNDVSFKDIEGHWAEEEINYLVEDNLLVGYDDGTFKPNVNITRAEAATVISRELGLEKVVSDFPDVAEDHWASGYIGAAAKAKILSGYNDGTFQPNENLSRAEMAIIVSKAYQLQGQTSIFTDTKGHWADSYIQTLAANNITVGYPDGTFRPEQEITRAEFASFVARVLEESFRPTEG